MSRTDEAIAAVREALRSDDAYVAELTRDLVRIPSVNPRFVQDPAVNGEAKVQDRLQQDLTALGFGVDRWDVSPGRPNIVADWEGSEERSLLLCGHVDVVPIGDPAQWTVEPFGGETKDGRLYGRGAVDMKSGVAACVAAARAIRKAGITLDGRLSIHTVVDEEAGGFGAMDAVAKGRLARAGIIAEPTWDAVMPAEGGLFWVRVTIRGRQGHAGWRFNEVWPQPEAADRLLPGVNAIELATRFLAALREFESIRCRTTYHPLVPPGLNTINPGVIRAGAGLGPDGLPVTMTNPAIIPDTAVIDLDYKFLPNEDPAQVRAEFEAFVHHFCQMDRWLRDNPITVDWDYAQLYFPPMDTPVDHPLVTSLVRRAGENGKPPAIKGFEAVADCAHYAGAGVPCVLFGPSGDGLHGYDEYVNLDSLERVTRTLAETVIDLCGVR
ncbi:M20 family metallopeptidase [Rubellimicrobium arenae]|uniref:M20 family metallopeptidase n=1 Tax=Rubellimicrobium arenae TaxID=2817372 RepID=UPI001B307E99|nr:ArgE/DapE family deacylase [Rubellimicrobium arenae]